MVVICRTVDVDAPNVTTDEALAMERAMDYLLENGHRRIAVIEGTPGLDSSRLRHGMADFYDPARPGSGGAPGYERQLPVCQRLHCGKAAFGQPTHAMLCFNDEMAFGARAAIVEAGPFGSGRCVFDRLRQLGYVGYSDMHLTTVERNMGEIARTGTKVLLRRLDEGIIDNRRIYLNNKLIIRDTVKRLEPAGERTSE